MALFDDIHAIMDCRAPEKLPVFALAQEVDARYAGLTYAEYLASSEAVVAAQLRSMRHFGWDWAWLHIDDTLEFEPLGVGVAGGENVVPCTANYLPFDRRTLNGLEVPDPRSARMPLLLDAATGLREAVGDALVSVESPRTSLEELFLRVIKEREGVGDTEPGQAHLS